MTDFSYILPAERCDKNVLRLVGGKAASLGEIVKAGCPIRSFLTITSEAYRKFIEYNKMQPLIVSLENASTDEEIVMVSAKIRRHIQNGSYPQNLEQELRIAYRRFCSSWGPLAVRSSATLEDAPGASFAGQYDSYLGVRTEEDFLHYVKKCYASLYTDRAASYRHKLGLPQDNVAMAVVIQKLVKARSAGVMFTLNPLNGDPSVAVIESSWGLGEAVVKGEVIPDKYVVNKITKEIVESKHSRNKPVKYEMMDDGSVKRIANSTDNSSLSINEEEAVKLVEYGLRLEKYFHRPQDIEWVVDKDSNIFLVQSRPVTVPTTVDRPSKQSNIVDTLDRVVASLLAGVKT
ncbi:MAG: PEP/pyruvate-binding domain-containing protein [Candidatus Caldarchaeum sp.]